MGTKRFDTVSYKLFKWAFLLMASILMVACSISNQLKEDIANYRGDGTISYLEAPFLGGDGVEILMDRMDLSEDVNVSYDLNGIPPHEEYMDGYMMYLLIPNPARERLLPDEGTLTLTVFQDDEVLKRITSSFGEMHRTRQHRMPARYHMDLYGSKNLDSFLIPIPESKRGSHYRINVRIHAPELVERISAYIYLRIGGYR